MEPYGEIARSRVEQALRASVAPVEMTGNEYILAV